jgi:DNA-binding transcriptional LysR family regulator
VFLAESRVILERTEQAAETARRAARGQTGRLAIGFIGPATYSVVPEILGLYRERFPDVALALHEWTSTEQIRRLHSRFIQVGFVRAPLGNATLVFETVRREPIVVILPEGHPLADEEEVPLKALANEPFIMVPRRREPAVYDLFISSCRGAGFNPQVVQEAHQIHTIVGLVAARVGVSFAGTSVKNLRRPGVVYRPLEAPSPELELAVARRREDPSRVLQAFLEVVEEVTTARPAANP